MKAAIITQARMGSRRFYGKVMKSVLGKPLLAHHFERLLLSKLPIFLATTQDVEDDVLVQCAASYGIKAHRGDRGDVLRRFWTIAQRFDLKVIIRVTADCPLIDGPLIAMAVDQYLKRGDRDLYLSPCLKRTLPRGLDFEIFSQSLLNQAYQLGHRSIDREHVTPYLYSPRPKNVRIAHVVEECNLSHWRLCVDAPEDLLLIEQLIQKHRADRLSGKELLNLLRKENHLFHINQNINQNCIE